MSRNDIKREEVVESRERRGCLTITTTHRTVRQDEGDADVMREDVGCDSAWWIMLALVALAAAAVGLWLA